MKERCILILFSVLILMNLGASVAQPGEKKSGDFQYSLSDNTITIIKYDGKDEEVTIPSTIVGFPVTSIGEKAFAFNLYIKDVTVPEGILTIKDNAFEGCTNLEKITLPEGLSVLENSVFHECVNLKTVTLPSSRTWLHLQGVRDYGISYTRGCKISRRFVLSLLPATECFHSFQSGNHLSG